MSRSTSHLLKISDRARAPVAPETTRRSSSVCGMAEPTAPGAACAGSPSSSGADAEGLTGQLNDFDDGVSAHIQTLCPLLRTHAHLLCLVDRSVQDRFSQIKERMRCYTCRATSCSPVSARFQRCTLAWQV
jgi:hypothetical protein